MFVCEGQVGTDLDEAAFAESGLDQRLGYPSGGVRCRSVHLGVVLTADGHRGDVSMPEHWRIDHQQAGSSE